MAVLTFIGALNVRCGFSGGRGAVVAAGAGAHNVTMIDPQQLVPVACGVAIVATVGRPRVIARFAGGLYETAAVMTGNALAGRVFKVPAHMAALAFHLQVKAGERKAGGKVIEGLIRAGAPGGGGFPGGRRGFLGSGFRCFLCIVVA